MLEHIPIQVGKFFIPTDFIVLEVDEDERIPIILGRSFLAIVGVLIEVKNDKLTLNISDNIIEFDVFRNNKEPPIVKTSCDDLKSTHGKE